MIPCQQLGQVVVNLAMSPLNLLNMLQESLPSVAATFLATPYLSLIGILCFFFQVDSFPFSRTGNNTRGLTRDWCEGAAHP